MRAFRRRSMLSTVVAAALVVTAIGCGGGGGDDGGEEAEQDLPGLEGPGVQTIPGTEATEIGVSADTIRITVISDVDNVPSPGLFQGPRDAMMAFAEHVNAQGGIAGRELEVQFLDSKLSPDEARSALIQACEDSFAIVGTAALFLTSLEPLTGCTDQAGAATGLPDLSVVQTTFEHACAPTSFSVNGTAIDCDTRDEVPQTYVVSAGPARYFDEEFDLERGSWVQGNDIQGALDGTLPVAAGERTIVDGEDFLTSALSPQSVYTPYVQSLRRDGVDYVATYGNAHMQATLLQEARVQGVTADVFTCVVSCYDEQLIEEAGDAAEGSYVTLAQLPFNETDSNENLDAMVGSVADLDGFGSMAWISGLLFQQAVEQVVEEQGPNALTRANLLAELNTIHDFDAGGLIGPTDIAAHRGSGCLVVTQVQDGEFVRVHPEEPGTLDCDEDNLVTVELDTTSS